MTDAKSDHEPTLVERWLREQQEWQRTLRTYADSMAKNDEFLVNLGNAMRGSLLAGKPYPTAGAGSPSAGETDERLDRVLFALNTLQGQLQDLVMSMEEIRKAVGAPPPASKTASKTTRKATHKARAKTARSTGSRARKARA